ncbi:uncharacterized protein LOC144666767 isoform X1 [Oculina patagonica]
MAEKREKGVVRDEITKLRLRLLEQKIRSQSRGNNTGLEVYDSSLASSSSGFQQFLQAETVKSNHLLQRVKEERQQQETTPMQNHEADHTKEMMTIMMSQNMQLQQLLLQQAIGPCPTESTQPHRLSSVRSLEVEQIGHREMTPFTTLPINSQTQRAKSPSVKWPPVTVLRKPSPKPLVARGIATPVRPTERVPDPQVRPQTTIKPEGFLNQIARNNDQVYPFPGPSRVRKLRHVGYVAWACFILISLLKQTAQRRLHAMEHLNSLINQAIEELHTSFYLDQNGSVYSTLQDAVKDNAFDLKINNTGVFQRLSQNSQAALSELSSMIETIVYNVIQIKPSHGLVSATRDGVLWHMVQEGTLLPPNYLWQVEKDNMTFSAQGAFANQAGTMLLLGLFISRGLVSTLLLKPSEYGLMDNAPSNLAISNLKVLGSILMKVVREVSSPKKKKIIPLASEISSQLFSDSEMKFIYKKLDETLIWCKANLKRWTDDYLNSLNRS